MAAAAGGKKGKKKWSKKNARDMANMEVLFAKSTYEKLCKEAPKVRTRARLPSHPCGPLQCCRRARPSRRLPRHATPRHGCPRTRGSGHAVRQPAPMRSAEMSWSWSWSWPWSRPWPHTLHASLRHFHWVVSAAPARAFLCARRDRSAGSLPLLVVFHCMLLHSCARFCPLQSRELLPPPVHVLTNRFLTHPHPCLCFRR